MRVIESVIGNAENEPDMSKSENTPLNILRKRHTTCVILGGWTLSSVITQLSYLGLENIQCIN